MSKPEFDVTEMMDQPVYIGATLDGDTYTMIVKLEPTHREALLAEIRQIVEDEIAKAFRQAPL